ncbi:hypothetical protein [Thermomonospora amylolytica]|uniref:hypothetical protein n=1 Tax=Thermomonospora amylolytica TaxID=1411117 RepID=UPI000E6CA554|nr:hypothetical protein [Thermomonospora amylolytica]
MDALVLSSECLLSKWGFWDGAEPDALLDLLDERGMDYPEDWTAVLRRLIREDLIPALDQRVEVVDIETCHNPIRARTVDGVDVVDQWTKVDTDVELTPETVAVPIARVLQVLEEERPSQRARLRT